MPSRATQIPSHLKKYIVDQNYDKYTPQDQAAWRFILRQLKDYLTLHAHPSYADGLRRTGISIDTIPKISAMNDRLLEFGWAAVAVSGFIPPAAFMEFQSLGILPIASDMRSIDHLTYTPAPDIVHEAAGHAPLLIHPEYAQYLKNYAQVARNAIIGFDDMEQYAAIRELSDLKEDPNSTPEQIRKVEERLIEINLKLKQISEAGWLSRMNWWTAEYGLIGSLENPQIFGAGLLSSVGESRLCLSRKVEKIPLSVRCIETSYDITEPQPQLFVTPDFETLNAVLEQLANRMAFRSDEKTGLNRAVEAKTVNTVQLDSGIQLSGKLVEFHEHNGLISFLKFSGPSALAIESKQMLNQGVAQHTTGFSTPIGKWKGVAKNPETLTDSELNRLGLNLNQKSKLSFSSGLQVEGEPIEFVRSDGRLVLITWQKCRVKNGAQVLFDPSWGQFDMAVGSKVAKVFGGAADREKFGELDDFVNARVPQRKWSEAQIGVHKIYGAVREIREGQVTDPKSEWQTQSELYLSRFSNEWLIGVELVELSHILHIPKTNSIFEKLSNSLNESRQRNETVRECIDEGIKIAGIKL